ASVRDEEDGAPSSGGVAKVAARVVEGVVERGAGPRDAEAVHRRLHGRAAGGAIEDEVRLGVGGEDGGLAGRGEGGEDAQGERPGLLEVVSPDAARGIDDEGQDDRGPLCGRRGPGGQEEGGPRGPPAPAPEAADLPRRQQATQCGSQATMV